MPFCKQKILRGIFSPQDLVFPSNYYFELAPNAPVNAASIAFKTFITTSITFILFFHVLLFFKVFCHTPRPMRTGENSRGCCSLRHWDLPDCLRFPNRISPFRPHR